MVELGHEKRAYFYTDNRPRHDHLFPRPQG